MVGELNGTGTVMGLTTGVGVVFRVFRGDRSDTLPEIYGTYVSVVNGLIRLMVDYGTGGRLGCGCGNGCNIAR